jgi:hypothetical protein
MDRFLRRGGVCTAVGLLAFAFLFPAEAGDRPGKEAPGNLARELVGTWILIGTPDKVGDPPKTGGRLKFFTGKHWCVTQSDAKTGKVIFHHGGTYKLDGDTYTETVAYASAQTAGLLQKTFQFKLKLKGDTLTQVPVGAENPFAEVWQRAK